MFSPRTRLMLPAGAEQWVFGIILALLGERLGMPAGATHARLHLEGQALRARSSVGGVR